MPGSWEGGRECVAAAPQTRQTALQPKAPLTSLRERRIKQCLSTELNSPHLLSEWL